MDCSDPYSAYCLDMAVGEFGRSLDAELRGVEGKTKQAIESKRQQVLRKWLDMPMQYRDPARSGMVQIPKKGED